jgi:hypothetical protein
MARFWFLFYAIFGPKYTRLALLLMVTILGFFFYCFVHEAFDSAHPARTVPLGYRSQPIDFVHRRRATPPRDVTNPRESDRLASSHPPETNKDGGPPPRFRYRLRRESLARTKLARTRQSHENSCTFVHGAVLLSTFTSRIPRSICVRVEASLLFSV